MSADGTPDPTPREPASILGEIITDAAMLVRGQDLGTTGAYRIAEEVLSSPEARAAVIAATPRDELLAALVADGTLTEERRKACGYCRTAYGDFHPSDCALTTGAATRWGTESRLVTRWEPLP